MSPRGVSIVQVGENNFRSVSRLGADFLIEYRIVTWRNTATRSAISTSLEDQSAIARAKTAEIECSHRTNVIRATQISRRAAATVVDDLVRAHRLARCERSVRIDDEPSGCKIALAQQDYLVTGASTRHHISVRVNQMKALTSSVRNPVADCLVNTGSSRRVIHAQRFRYTAPSRAGCQRLPIIGPSLRQLRKRYPEGSNDGRPLSYCASRPRRSDALSGREDLVFRAQVRTGAT